MVNPAIKRPEFSVAERIAMIVWLQREGYASWMKNTGAWWKIFLNRSDPMIMVDDTGDDAWATSAGDLVSRYSFGELEGIVLRKCRAAKSKERLFRTSLP